MFTQFRTALWLAVLGMACRLHAGESLSEAQSAAARWRADRRTVDLHQHITCTTQYLARAVRIMDAVGLGVVVNLSGGTVTARPDGKPSQFERNETLARTLFPGRFVHYMSLDYSDWNEADFSARAVRQIEEGHRLGAGGFKEFKRLGLNLRDRAGDLIGIDDPKLDPMWKRCGELNMPVSIHVADPKAFGLPYDEQNERWKELKGHKSWWFGDTNKFPAWKDLLEALNRVIARHPETTFVCVHFANNAEELEWVDQSLSRYPNMMVDLAARIPELGRHDPETVRRLFLKHQDRILFATDFMVDQRLILGSSGNEPPPSDADAEVYFLKNWRWLETRDRNWEHMTPIQGDWAINSVGLPGHVLRKIYFDNARKLLARSFPAPRLQSRRISQDFELDGTLSHALWQTASLSRIELGTLKAEARPELSTTIRSLYSNSYLYLGFECPFTKLTQFEPTQTDSERFDLNALDASLWDRDVVEAFIASDAQHPGSYAELEVAPTNERLDVLVDGARKDFPWSSGFQSAVKVNKKTGVWTCELRVPLKALGATAPKPGAVWRANFYRCDRANKAYLAWNPTMSGSFHVPQRFGLMEFSE